MPARRPQRSSWKSSIQTSRKNLKRKKRERRRAHRNCLIENLEPRQMMTVDLYSQENNDTISTAQTALVSAGTQFVISGYVGNGNQGNADVDFYRVSIEAGQSLNADIDAQQMDNYSSLSSLNSYLRLFDQYGGLVASNDNGIDPDTGNTTGDSVLDYTSSYGGYYYLGVSDNTNTNYDPDMEGYGSSSGYGGDYQLHLSLAGYGGSSGTPEISVYDDAYGGTSILDDYGSYAFGTTDQYSPLQHTFQVTNDGTDTLTLGSIQVSSGFSVFSSFGSTSLAPGASTTFTIRLNADYGGTYNGSVNFSTNDSDENPFNFNLSGTVDEYGGYGGAPEITLYDEGYGGSSILDDYGSYAFGTTDLYTSLQHTFRVENDGTDTLTLGALQVPYGYSVYSSFGDSTLEPGENTTFTIRLNAEYGGTYNGSLSFTTNDTDENPFNFNLSGTVDEYGGYGGSPEITVYDEGYGGSSILDGYGSYTFGTTNQGNPITHTFRIENDGDGTLSLGQFTLPTGFSLVSGVSSTSLAPGQSTTFQIQLIAANVGSYSGTLSFSNNDSDEGPFNFTVSGVVNYAGEPEITVQDGSSSTVVDGTTTVDFGTTNVGTPVNQTFTIRNDGTANLTLNSSNVVIPSGWQIIQPFATTVSAGNETTFILRYLAESSGTSTGAVTFLNNDTDEGTFSFDVTAQAIPVSAPEITVRLDGVSLTSGNANVDFGDVSEHGSATRTIMIHNDGTQTLTLDTGSLQVPAGYQVVTPFGSSVAPGSSTSLVLKLQSTMLGSYSGTVQFTSNDSDESPFSFDVVGSVVAHVPQISIDDMYTEEGNTATFQVTLSATSSATVTVDYATIAGTATAGTDFTSVSGTLTFAPGETVKTIDVPILSDGLAESEETYTVELSNAFGGTILDGTGDGHILDQLPPNQTPTVATSLPNSTIDEDSGVTTINLAPYFDDPNLVYGDTLTYTVETSDPALIAVVVNGNSLLITPLANQNGTATLTVTATDSEGLYVSDSFDLTVTAVNDAPMRTGLIPDRFPSMNDDPVVIDLSAFLTDVDGPLSYSATTDQTDLVSTSVTDGELTVTLLQDAFGTAEITVTGTDSAGLTVQDTFRVVITRTNVGPMVASPIADMDLDEDFETISIDLSTVFGDADLVNLSDTLTYQLRQNDNDLDPDELSILDAYISHGKLLLTPAPGVAGQATLTVRATDEFTEFVDETFTIVVSAVNDAPEVSNPFGDQVTIMNGAPLSFDLDTLFTDEDLLTTGDSLTFTVFDNSNATVVNASVNGSQLLLAPQTDQYGDATITIRAMDAAGATADYIFDMSVAYVAQAPTVANSIADVTLAEDASATVVDLSTVFADVDIAILSDSLSLTFSMDGDEIVTGELVDSQLSLTPIVNASGVVTITVTGTDQDGNSVSDAFDVAITAADDMPAVMVDPISLNYTEGITYSLVNLAKILQDSDVFWGQDTLTYTVEANSNTTLASTAITGDTLRIDFAAEETGTVNLTLRATDGNSQYAETLFTVTIAAETDPYVGQIINVELVNDTANSGDNISANAGIVGEVYGVNQEYDVAVEFDHDNDGIAEGTKKLGHTEAIPVDYFAYDPRYTDPTLESYYGSLTLRYRPALMDELGITTSYRDWESFSYEIIPPNASSVISSIGLANDDGTSTTDKVTTDPELEGTVANHPYARIELDLDGDQLADKTVFADKDGNWSATPLLTSYGSTTIGHRTRHWDEDAGTFVAGPWSDFTFTLEPESAPEVENFRLLEDWLDEGESDGGTGGNTYTTSEPLLIGNLLVPVVEEETEEDDLDFGQLSTGDSSVVSALAYLEIEIDLDNDGTADDFVFTDETGAFTYAPKGLTDGSNTIQARSVQVDWRTGQNVYGAWKQYTFEFVSKPIPEVELLRLWNDTGISATDQISEDTTLIGRLSFVNGLPEGGTFVEFDHDGDDVIDGLAEFDTDGVFQYQPSGLTAGSHTIRARVTMWSDNELDFVTGAWTSITFEKSIPVNTPATITQFGLYNDNGVNSEDGITTDAAVSGLIVNEEGSAFLSVEFDHDGDGTVDGRVAAVESGQFVYIPLGVGQGSQTIHARVREWDYYAQAFIYGSWESTSFTVADPVNSVATIDSLALLSDTGSSSSDNVTANASLIGAISNVEGLSGLEIEFDQDNDGTADDHVYTDATGTFYIDPYLLDVGTHTFQARVREWDHYTGTYLTSNWTSITIDYEDQPNVAAEIIALGVAGGMDVNGTLTSANTLIQGQIRNEAQLSGVTIEIDTDADGTADAYAETDQHGQFEYRLPNPAAGTISINFRTREFDWETGAELIGTWETLTFHFAPEMNEAPELADVMLVNDTGDDANDLITTDPSIAGVITNDGSLGGLQVQVDINEDDIFDMTATTDTNGQFELKVVGLTPGEHTLKLRVKEYNEQNVALYSDWTPFTFELETISLSNQSGVEMLGLLNDTGLDTSDLSTADATLTGMLSSGLGSGNITIEFDQNGDGIVDGTTTAQSGQTFQYLPTNLQSGYQSIQARIAGGGEWRTMEFVVSDQPDAAEAQELANSIGNYQSSFDQIKINYQSALANISIGYSSRISGAIDDYDSAIAGATGSYDDAIQSADSQFAAVLAQAKQQLLASQATANAQFQIDMANFAGDKTQFEFSGFSVPDAIQFASAQVPAYQDQPTVPDYESDPKPYYYDVHQDPAVNNAIAVATTTRLSAMKDAYEAEKVAIKQAADSSTQGVAQALRVFHQEAAAAAKQGQEAADASENEAVDETGEAIEDFEEENASTDAEEAQQPWDLINEDTGWYGYYDFIGQGFGAPFGSEIDHKWYFVYAYYWEGWSGYTSDFDSLKSGYDSAVNAIQNNSSLSYEDREDQISAQRVSFWQSLSTKDKEISNGVIDDLEKYQKELIEKKFEFEAERLGAAQKLEAKLADQQHEQELEQISAEIARQKEEAESLQEAQETVDGEEGDADQEARDAAHTRAIAELSASENAQVAISNAVKSAAQGQTALDGTSAASHYTQTQTIVSDTEIAQAGALATAQVAIANAKLTTDNAVADEEDAAESNQPTSQYDQRIRQLELVEGVLTKIANAKHEFIKSEQEIYYQQKSNFLNADKKEFEGRLAAATKFEKAEISTRNDAIQNFQGTCTPTDPYTAMRAYVHSGLLQDGCSWPGEVAAHATNTQQKHFEIAQAEHESNLAKLEAILEYHNGTTGTGEGGTGEGGTGEGGSAQGYYGLYASYKTKIIDAIAEFNKSLLSMNDEQAEADEQASDESQKNIQQIQAAHSVAVAEASYQLSVSKAGLQRTLDTNLAAEDSNYQGTRLDESQAKLQAFDQQQNSAWSQMQLANFTSYSSNFGGTVTSAIQSFLDKLAEYAETYNNTVAEAEKDRTENDASDIAKAIAEELDANASFSSEMRALSVSFAVKMIDNKAKYDKSQISAGTALSETLADEDYEIQKAFHNNAFGLEMVSIEWTYSIPGQYHSHTVQEATATRVEADLTAQEKYSKKYAVAQKENVVATEDAKVQLAEDFKSAASETASKSDEKSSGHRSKMADLAKSIVSKLKEHAVTAGTQTADAEKKYTIDSSDAESDFIDDTISGQSSQNLDELSHRNDFTESFYEQFFTDLQAGAASAGQILNAQAESAFVAAQNALAESYNSSAGNAIRSLISGVSEIGSTYASSLAIAANQIAKASIKSSASFYQSSIEAEIDADKDSTDADAEFSLAEYNAYLGAVVSAATAEADAAKARSEADVAWTNTMAPHKKAHLLAVFSGEDANSAQETYDNRKEEADEVRDNSYHTADTDSVTGVADALIQYANSYKSALSQRASQFGEIETDFFSSIGKAVSAAQSRKNAAASSGLSKVQNAESQQTSGVQSKASSYDSAMNAAAITKVTGMQSPLENLGTSSVQAQFLEFNAAASDYVIRANSQASGNPGLQSDIFVAQAVGQQGFIANSEASYSQRALSTIGGQIANQLAQLSGANSLSNSATGLSNGYNNSVLSGQAKLESATLGKGGDYIQALVEAQSTFFEGRAEANGELGQSSADDRGQYLVDVLTANKAYQLGILNEDSSAEGTFDSEVLSLDLALIDSAFDAQSTWSSTVASNLGTFNSTSISERKGLVGSNATAARTFSITIAGEEMTLTTGVNSALGAYQSSQIQASAALGTSEVSTYGAFATQQADNQQLATSSINGDLGLDYTQFLVDKSSAEAIATSASSGLMSQQVAATITAAIGASQAALLASSSATQSVAQASSGFDQSVANSTHSKETAIANTLASSASQLASSVTSYQQAESNAYYTYQSAIQKANRRFEDDEDATARDSAIASATSTYQATLKQLSETYTSAAISAEGAYQDRVAQENTNLQNNIGQASTQAIQGIAGAATSYANTSGDIQNAFRHDTSGITRDFGQQQSAARYNAIQNELSGNSDPWSQRLTAQEAAYQTAVDAVWAGYEAWENTRADADNQQTKDQAAADSQVQIDQAEAAAYISRESALAEQAATEQANLVRTMATPATQVVFESNGPGSPSPVRGPSMGIPSNPHQLKTVVAGPSDEERFIELTGFAKTILGPELGERFARNHGLQSLERLKVLVDHDWTISFSGGDGKSNDRLINSSPGVQLITLPKYISQFISSGVGAPPTLVTSTTPRDLSTVAAHLNELISESKVTYNGNNVGYFGSPDEAALSSFVESPFALAVISLAPGVGEAVDIYVLFHKDSTNTERAIAAGSLALSFVTAGFAPNFSGAAAKGLRSAKEAAEGTIQGTKGLVKETVTESVGAVSEVVETQAKNLPDAARTTAKSAEQALDIVAGQRPTCFAAGTPVLTPHGAKKIEDLEVGDVIWSRSEDNPQAEVRKSHVEKVFKLSGQILELRVNGQLIETTAEHPFFVAGKGWVPGHELLPGDQLVGLEDQTSLVESVVSTQQRTTVYNIRVAEDHTYFVGCREWGFELWVHNAYSVKQAADGTFSVVDESGTAVRNGLGSLDEAEDLCKVFNAPNGIGQVLESSASSWKKHGSRLYGDLKNKFGIDLPFKAKDPNVRKLVAQEYQKLIDNGTLKYLGFADDVHGSYHFYEHGGNLYLFAKDGSLVSRWAPGSQGRAIDRILELLGGN